MRSLHAAVTALANQQDIFIAGISLKRRVNWLKGMFRAPFGVATGELTNLADIDQTVSPSRSYTAPRRHAD